MTLEEPGGMRMNRPCSICGQKALPDGCPDCGVVLCRGCADSHVVEQIIKDVRRIDGIELPTTCAFCKAPAPAMTVIDLALKLAVSGKLNLLCCPAPECLAELAALGSLAGGVHILPTELPAAGTARAEDN